MDRLQRIRALNDQLRAFPLHPVGELVLTVGVMALSIRDRFEVLRKVVELDTFTADNDPHGEHDFGAFDHAGERCFWKIDCYDCRKLYHSPDPADPDVTRRVLTVMRADEY